jgi:hypothetical protein
VNVPGDDIRVAIANRDERLAEIPVADASGAEETSVRSAGIAQFNNV